MAKDLQSGSIGGRYQPWEEMPAAMPGRASWRSVNRERELGLDRRETG